MIRDPAQARGGRRPLTRILAAFEGGAATPAEVIRRTGLSAQIVTAGVEHLVRTGRLVAEPLSLSCPPQGCGACPAGETAATICRPLLTYRLATRG